ncbi:hypothetical protein LZ30DRAFT_196882 [Colletotrichum cereale]|nr:hypothetical protein LZ30DRAFT_196882 [Colletotrichum cereale]
MRSAVQMRAAPPAFGASTQLPTFMDGGELGEVGSKLRCLCCTPACILQCNGITSSNESRSSGGSVPKPPPFRHPCPVPIQEQSRKTSKQASQSWSCDWSICRCYQLSLPCRNDCVSGASLTRLEVDDMSPSLLWQGMRITIPLVLSAVRKQARHGVSSRGGNDNVQGSHLE